MGDARRGGISVTRRVARLATLTHAESLVACGDGSSDAIPKSADAASLEAVRYVVTLGGGLESVDAEDDGHHAAAWSPAGTRLAYGFAGDGLTDVRIATLVSATMRTVESTPVSTREGSAGIPRANPAGRRSTVPLTRLEPPSPAQLSRRGSKATLPSLAHRPPLRPSHSTARKFG